MNTSFAMLCTLVLEAAAMSSTAIPKGDVLAPVPLDKVRVGGEIGRRIDVTVNNNLLVINIDKDFLQPFREKNRADGYIGLGKLIDSIVHFAVYTKDPRVLDLKKRVIAETIKTQLPDGYSGLLKPESRVWMLWDVHEMSYLVYGLLSDHEHFGEAASLDAARRTMDYIIARWSADPQHALGDGAIANHMAATGVEQSLLLLYQRTGDARYLDFCVKVRKLPEWDYPIVIGRWGDIGGHAYAYMYRCIAQLTLNHIQPDPRLLLNAQKVVDFLSRRDGLSITGICGDHECWHDSQAGTTNLGESCTAAYLIRFLDALMRMNPNARYGDVMERTIYNALFGAQSPDGRRIRYYTPFDGPRTYFPSDTYCCPCNYRRIVAELPSFIYYRFDGGLLVNLLAPSQAEIDLDSGLSATVRQETDYPNSGRIVLHVSPSKAAAFTVRLRIPVWATGTTVAVNGERLDKPVQAGAFLDIRRDWREGDRVELQVPMAPRWVKGRKAQAGRVAVLRGPIVYCLNRESHKDLKTVEPRMLTINPTTLKGPTADKTVRPDGQSLEVAAWAPGAWYPMEKAAYVLKLTEYADPQGEATFFHVPNPNAEGFVEDDLVTPPW